MLALSIRQPFAELILRGIKTIEYRSRATKIIGERFYIYASKGRAAKKIAWSTDLSGAAVPPWMVELANGLKLFPHELPTGVIVGSAIIERVDQREDGMWQWHLWGVERAKTLRMPSSHPQPTWWRAEFASARQGSAR